MNQFFSMCVALLNEEKNIWVVKYTVSSVVLNRESSGKILIFSKHANQACKFLKDLKSF